MKIEHETPTFQKVAVGDAFMTGDATFIKIDQLFATSTDPKNAICLNDGKPCWLKLDTVVLLCPDAKVIV